MEGYGVDVLTSNNLISIAHGKINGESCRNQSMQKQFYCIAIQVSCNTIKQKNCFPW